MGNLEKYNEIFVDVFSVDESELNELFTRDMVRSWDSIHQLNLVSYIEEVFDVMFGTDDALSLTSYLMGLEILSLKYNISF